MPDRTPLETLDLLALADGQLDQEPDRRAEVERMLAASPAALERARAYRAQTEALRRACGGRLAEPVPERLQAVLEAPERRAGRAGLRVAAVAALAAVAGVGGWTLGQIDRAEGWSVATLVDRSYRSFVAGGEEVFEPAGVGPRPLGWLENEVAIRLQAPDLSAEGYRLTDKRALALGGDQIVRLDYAGPRDRSFSLFLAPRWEPGPAGISQAERDGISLAYWLDGPLAASVLTRLPEREAKALAEAVRRAMHAETPTPSPVLEPEFAPLGEPATGLMAETLAAPTAAERPPQAGAVDDDAVRPN